MGHQHETGSGTLTTLVAGAVIGAAGLAWWLLNEADRRSRINRQRSMLHAPRMQDGSEVLEPSGKRTTGTAGGEAQRRDRPGACPARTPGI